MNYVGPVCDECKKHRPVLITVLERKETNYGYEMVKKNLCPYHFAILIDEYENEYSDEIPENESSEDENQENNDEKNDENDDE